MAVYGIAQNRHLCEGDSHVIILRRLEVNNAGDINNDIVVSSNMAVLSVSLSIYNGEALHYSIVVLT